MEFLPGFRWAVPRAFADAVSLCRFEEGDILYDTEKAYNDEWEESSKFIGHSLQVKYPARASGGTSSSSGGVFSSNWSSEVRIDLYRNLEKVGVGQMHTTQGRLYTALWKGDLSILDNVSEEPPIPLTAQDATRNLVQASQKATELSVGFPVFVMARDFSNPVSRNKYSKVLTRLKNHLHSPPTVLTPKQAGLRQFHKFAPTVEVAFFSMKGTNAADLQDLIKSAVYARSKDAKREMFRISAHGIIV